MAYLLTRNSRIEEDLIDQLINPSERRLARLLFTRFERKAYLSPLLCLMASNTAAMPSRPPTKKPGGDLGPH
jgi:CRP/FNR family cyclic AMP-dependent transcriptional regulator